MPQKSSVHFTDLNFVKFCIKEYGINRGIYNAIDSWMYNQGLKNILSRRYEILNFLEYLSKRSRSGDRIEKFGSGGLSQRLNEFWQQRVLQLD